MVISAALSRAFLSYFTFCEPNSASHKFSSTCYPPLYGSFTGLEKLFRAEANWPEKSSAADVSSCGEATAFRESYLDASWAKISSSSR